MRAIVQSMAGAGVEAGARPRRQVASMGPKLGRPTLKQCTFGWSSIARYTESLGTSHLEVNNKWQTYNTNKADTEPTISNWLGRQGKQFLGVLAKKS